VSEQTYWTQRRFGRRAALRGGGAALFGVAGAALIGCGAADEAEEGETVVRPTPADALREAEERATHGDEAVTFVRGSTFTEDLPWHFEEGEPVRGGVFETYYTADVRNFSPFHSGGFGLHEFYDWPFFQMYRGPRLFFMRGVEAIEWVDSTTFILRMKDAHFQDVAPVHGRKVTAEDLMASIELRRDDSGAGYHSWYRDIVDWGNTAVVDEKTLKVGTIQPRNDFFEQMWRPYTNKESIEMHVSGEKPLTEWEWPSGSGPFALKELRHGAFVQAERHPGYARADITYMDGLKWSLIPDASAREAQFRAGQLSHLPAGDRLFYEAMLSDLGRQIYGVHNLSLNPTQWTQLNQTVEPWTDERVRKAYVRALDRERIRDLMGEIEGPMNPPGITAGYSKFKLPADDPDAADWNMYDPADAKALLAAARSSGMDVDRTMEMIVQTSAFYGDLASTVRPFLQDVGFKVDIVSLPAADARERYLQRPGRFDMAFDNWLIGGWQLGMYLRAHHSNSLFTNQNATMFDPQVDAAIEQWEGLVDLEELEQKAQDIERLLIQKTAVVFPLYSNNWRKLYQRTVRNTNPDWADALQPQHWIDPSYRVA
jgi:ABC-type transport system substrate-binding protein